MLTWPGGATEGRYELGGRSRVSESGPGYVVWPAQPMVGSADSTRGRALDGYYG